MKFYQVGGSVRDELLKHKHDDIDFAVEASSYLEMKTYLISNGFTIFIEKPEYLSLKARNPNTKQVCDYTLCRKDGYYSDNRRPDSVEVTTIVKDLSRRDFTINAIAKNEDDEYIDPFNGIQDIKDKIIRCVGNIDERLKEDPLRLLRCLRLKVTKNFDIEEKLYQTIMNPSEDLIKGLNKLAIERVHQELQKMFRYDSVKSLKTLSQLPDKLLNVIFRDSLRLIPSLKK